MTEGDLTAIATYLDHLNQGAAKPAAQVQTATEKLLISADPAMDLGPRLYLDNCAACHFATGRGADEVFPELDGSSLVTAQSPTGLISMILRGGALPSTAARSDRQSAAALDKAYLRSNKKAAIAWTTGLIPTPKSMQRRRRPPKIRSAA
jgi:mono/diheme cytochrome c family protein